MASVFYGINRGEGDTSVATGASTQSKDFEIQVDLTNTPTKLELRNAVLHLLTYIDRNDWTGA
jgi:hypothetical protein